MSSVGAVVNIGKTVATNIIKTCAKNGLSTAAAKHVGKTVIAGAKWMGSGPVGMVIIAAEFAPLVYQIGKNAYEYYNNTTV